LEFGGGAEKKKSLIERRMRRKVSDWGWVRFLSLSLSFTLGTWQEDRRTEFELRWLESGYRDWKVFLITQNTWSDKKRDPPLERVEWFSLGYGAREVVDVRR
jgi:hypothetical protein